MAGNSLIYETTLIRGFYVALDLISSWLYECFVPIRYNPQNKTVFRNLEFYHLPMNSQ